MPPKKNNKDYYYSRLAKQRLCKKRRYEEIKNNPELLAIMKEKRRAKYLKDKEEKKVKSISEQTARIQREQRKRWKENSKRYRQKKHQEKVVSFEAVQTIAGPSNHGEMFPKQKEDTSDQDQIVELQSDLSDRSIQRLKRKNRHYQCLRRSRRDMQNDTVALGDDSHQNSSPAKTSTKERVRYFFLDDVNSTVGAGKKQLIRRNDVRMQITDTFVMRVTKCVCCLEKDAEELLWEERPHVGSYGDLIKELFDVQFPVPDSVSNATRICGACAADVDRAFEVRARMLEAQATLATAHWLIPPPQLTIPPPRRIGTSRKLHSAGLDNSYNGQFALIQEEIHDIDEHEWKSEDEVDIEEHEVSAVSKATRSLVPRLFEDAHTVQGMRKRTAKRQAIPAQSFLEQESQTYELMDTTEEPYVTAELDDVKLEPDPLGEDTELCQETDQMKYAGRRRSARCRVSTFTLK